ncbi:MAG: hypothetical protein RBT11_19095 [Desulfobacterales bacterium]|jgi:hypothetical protein|nr:hypothetical protein [Desulfobacterales bacterium]
MTTAYQEESFLGSGDLQIAIYDPSTGTLGGERDVGNAQNFVINPPSIEKKELIGMRRANYAQTIKSVITKSEQEIKFTLTDINRKNLALAMFGTDADNDQTEDDNVGSAESIVAHLDAWTPLTHRNLDTQTAHKPVVKNSAGDATYDEGDDHDYVVDYETGRIMALSTGDIGDGATLKVEYYWAATTGFKVTANDVNKFECFIRMIGMDQANERDCEVIVYKAQIEPSGDMSWLTEDFATLEFTGKILAMAAGTWAVLFHTDAAATPIA